VASTLESDSDLRATTMFSLRFFLNDERSNASLTDESKF